MDNLTKMCRDKRIQALARWEAGEMTDKGIITDIYEDRGDSFRWAEISVNETEGLQSKISDLIWLPTRSGTVEGWLVSHDFYVVHTSKARGNMRFTISNGLVEFQAPTELEAKIKLYMWVEHKKKWKEGKWKRKSYTGG